MQYHVSSPKPQSRFINITVTLSTHGRAHISLQLASWRPGRYELGNFAKNIKDFQVHDEKGTLIPCRKTTKDHWEIDCAGSETLVVTYRYFAAVLDAGSTFTGRTLLYINPVNCLIYDTQNMDKPCELTLDVPEYFDFACSMPRKGNTFFAKNYDQLADAPLIAEKSIQHHTYTVGGTVHHVWMRGEHTFNIEKFVAQAKLYTAEQLAIFGDFESTDYHYLIHFLPNRFHHGVEHSESTVIVMGPGTEFHRQDFHNEMLAICSHELFHYWNIKRIRPASMFPYDYTRENYSTLGYIYEGITTYYGDYMLLRSGVFNFDDYAHEFSKDLQKHYDNEGRYNYTVAESSFDTWLDGYVPGVPGRKVSIYVEGMLSALILDIEIRYATQNKKCLDDVMRTLYTEYYKKDKGYTEADFKQIIETVAGKSFDYYFQDFIHGKGNIEKLLPETLASIGCELKVQPSTHLHEKLYGFHISSSHGVMVTAVLENSPAERAGLAVGDEILLVNNIQVTQGVEWNEIFNHTTEMLCWNTIFGKKEVMMTPDGNTYFDHYHLVKMKNATEEQKAFYKAWSKQDF